MDSITDEDYTGSRWPSPSGTGIEGIIDPRSARHVAEGYRLCADLSRRQARNFFYAFALLPRRQRFALYAVYTFCRRCDDIADGPLPARDKRIALKRKEQLLDQLYARDQLVPTVEAAALADTIHRFNIPRSYFDDFLLGVRSDLAPPRYRSFADLRTYCYRVASAVGLITMEILGYDRRYAEDVHAAAVELGLAMQLTNILRDVKEDARRGRIYLPEAERQEYDLTPSDITEGVVDERFRAFMAFQIRRARQHFARASRLLSYMPRRGRVCPATLSAFYSRILDRIESLNYDIYRHRAELTPFQKAGLTFVTVGRSWFLPAPKFS